MKVASSGAVAKSITGLQLKDRTVYTAVAVGLAGNGTLQVIPLVDAAAPVAPSAPSTGTGTMADGGFAWAAVGFGLIAVAGTLWFARKARATTRA